jgi:hypothetical protein
VVEPGRDGRAGGIERGKLAVEAVGRVPVVVVHRTMTRLRAFGAQYDCCMKCRWCAFA